MASSNRHWPSMFKSKPCNTHHQWHNDINPSSFISSACHRTHYPTVHGCEERSPEPKPRWNPKPEQIRILEAIFNSGMVNPPRDEIRKIRAQLQEFGQVGDANVFYWFQNRKSRSKHKLRHLQNSKQNLNPPITTSVVASSSSSSGKSSPIPKGSSSRNKTLSLSSAVANSHNESVSQTYFQTNGELLPETFFFPAQPTTNNYTQGFCFSELSNMVQVPEQQTSIGPCTSLSEMMNHGGSMKEQEVKIKMPSNTITTAGPTRVNISSPIIQPQGVGETGVCSAKSTVFINDMAIEVGAGNFNVREAFGEEAVLINSSGQPVLTNQWGVTLQPLQHAAFYYLI